MSMLRNLLLCFSVWLALAPPPLLAQAGFPNKVVKVIVPFPAGGSADVLARIVGDKLSTRWGQPVVVENRAGAGGNIGAEAVYRAEPDGYTLLSSPPGPLSINHNLYKDLPFEPERFVPITVLALVPNVISIKVDLPAGSVKELIAHAKANPGKVVYASQGNGSTSHLSAQMFATMAGVSLVHIPYKGEGPALVDIVAGRVDMFIGNIAAGLRFHQAGKVKFLAVASVRRSPVAPEVPTAAEAGLPGFVASAWFALAAPPGTPNAIAQQINAAAVEALRLPDVQKKFLEQGAEPVGNSTAEMAAFVKEEMTRWQNVIKTANVTLQ
ncbi:MAG: tripartite tricarboxylate transporter substrate binding protein [Betaproteobacteria bacterium]|nr:tripartite tricarboxylate transporter substrate binding protein [Betaproteobacteria bacterium]